MAIIDAIRADDCVEAERLLTAGKGRIFDQSSDGEIAWKIVARVGSTRMKEIFNTQQDLILKKIGWDY